MKKELINYSDGFATASKEDLIQAAQVTIEDMIEGGLIDPLQEYTKIKKAILFFQQAEKHLLSHAIDEIEKDKSIKQINGVALSVTQGTTRLNYDEDHKVKELKETLKERQELVKLATKSKDPIYDSEGVEVEKVSKTESGQTIRATIK